MWMALGVGKRAFQSDTEFAKEGCTTIKGPVPTVMPPAEKGKGAGRDTPMAFKACPPAA